MQPPSSFTITIFLLFDLSFEYLGIFFYITIVGPSFTLKLHTWKSSNPHIPNDCDTTTVCTCMFKRIFSGTSSQAGELNTPICTSHSQRAHISRTRACFTSTLMLHTYCTAIILVSIVESILPSAPKSATNLSVSVGTSAAQAPQASDAAAK